MINFLLKLSAFFFVLAVSNSYSQVNKQWTSFYNGAANDTDIVSSFFVDNSGNVYVTGFSIGSGTRKDFATIKYNSSGVLQWAARYNNTDINEDDVPTSITVDVSGNVYVTGHSAGNGTFKDYLTIKYSSSGDQLWLARYNGKGNDDDIAYDIAIDGDGNVYVTGSSVGSITSEDFATIKYNPAGVEQWISIYNNNIVDDIDIATSIALDNGGNVCVAGYSIGENTAEDYTTIKYTSDGDEVWVSRYNGPDNKYDITSAIAVDITGNVYVTGYSFGGNSSEDYLTIKYNSSGNEQWTARYNGQANKYDISSSIAVDNSGNVFVTGFSSGAKTSEDYATIKYNSSGIEQWVSRYDGDDNGYDIATTVKVDNSGNVYVTGYSYNTGSEENYATIKYDPAGNEQWLEIFDGKTNGSDIVTSLGLDEEGNVYVTGYSYEGITGVDYVTIKYSQTVGIKQNQNSIPIELNLHQNYPNPFNPVTKIEYEISTVDKTNIIDVHLIVYNSLGSEVATLVNEKQNAGTYSVEWNASNFSSGVYFYKLVTDEFIETKKMTLLK